MAMIKPERDLEEALVTKLRDLKYELYRFRFPGQVGGLIMPPSG